MQTTTPFSPEQTANALGELKRDQLRTMATGLKIDGARKLGKPELIAAIGDRLREIADAGESEPTRVGHRSPRGSVLTPAGTGTTRTAGKRQPGRKFGPPTKLSRVLASAG